MYYASLLVFPTVTCCVCQQSIKALLTYLLTYYSFLSSLVVIYILTPSFAFNVSQFVNCNFILCFRVDVYEEDVTYSRHIVFCLRQILSQIKVFFSVLTGRKSRQTWKFAERSINRSWLFLSGSLTWMCLGFVVFG